MFPNYTLTTKPENRFVPVPATTRVANRSRCPFGKAHMGRRTRTGRTIRRLDHTPHVPRDPVTRPATVNPDTDIGGEHMQRRITIITTTVIILCARAATAERRTGRASGRENRSSSGPGESLRLCRAAQWDRSPRWGWGRGVAAAATSSVTNARVRTVPSRRRHRETSLGGREHERRARAPGNRNRNALSAHTSCPLRPPPPTHQPSGVSFRLHSREAPAMCTIPDGRGGG